MKLCLFGWFCFLLISMESFLRWMNVTLAVSQSTRINTMPNADHLILFEMGAYNQALANLKLTILLPPFLRVGITDVHHNWPSTDGFISVIQWKQKSLEIKELVKSASLRHGFKLSLSLKALQNSPQTPLRIYRKDGDIWLPTPGFQCKQCWNPGSVCLFSIFYFQRNVLKEMS